jgi:hypothetical protein
MIELDWPAVRFVVDRGIVNRMAVWRRLYPPAIKEAGDAKAERCHLASVTGTSRI